MRRQLATIVSSIFLVLLWFAYDGTAAFIFDPLLNPLRDYLVNAATWYLSHAINGTIEVGALRGSLFSTPVLQQVVVRDIEGEVVARIKEIRLSYELTSLIRGSLRVNTIEIVRPWLRIVEEPDGVLNISTESSYRCRKRKTQTHRTHRIPLRLFSWKRHLANSGFRLRW